MKYQEIIKKINGGKMSRIDLARLRRNAEEKLAKGDLEAKGVISALYKASPPDTYILFMGFCPGADFRERLDTEWKQKGICRFDFLESERQLSQFYEICAGDRVVLKKREKFAETMKLYGHGQVRRIVNDENDIRYLIMDWSEQNEVIEVPLMGCNATVNIRFMEEVENAMPGEFFKWLKV